MVKVSGEISQYLDSLESAWSLYLDEVRTKLENEMVLLNELQISSRNLANERAELEKKLPVESKPGINFRFFKKKIKDILPLNELQYKDIEKKLSEIINQEEEIKKELLRKRGTKKAGESYIILKEKLSVLDKRLVEISAKLEERHQKMTLLMKPMVIMTIQNGRLFWMITGIQSRNMIILFQN